MTWGDMRRTAVIVALLTLVVCGGCTARHAGEPIEGPVLAAVSYSPNEVILIEPATLAVIERVGLRSMGTDPLALDDRRLFVTAQCGGLGDDADDAIALIDLERGGGVRYMDLPESNPGFVESAGDGTVLVSYGLWDSAGVPVTRVDLGAGVVVGRGLVANAYGPLVVAAGSLWTAGPEGEDVVSPEYTLRRTSLDLTASKAFPADGRGPVIAPDARSADTLLLVTNEGTSARVDRVSAGSLEVLASVTVDDLRSGVSEVISAGDVLVLRDSSGEDVAEPGGPLIVLDGETLQEMRRIDVGGSVSSVVSLGEDVFAVRWDSGELILLDPASGTIERRALIEGLAGRMVQLSAMDAADAPRGR